MRLNPHERTAIVEAVRAAFGPNAAVRLFGSRTQDSRRGGDIDLFVEVDPADYSYSDELELQLELLKRLGDQRVDVLVHQRGQPLSPIDRVAKETGIPL